MTAQPVTRVLPLLFKLPPLSRLIVQMLMIVGYSAILYWDFNSVFTTPFYAAVLVAAWLRGGPDERRMALILTPASVATLASFHFLGVWGQFGVFMIDCVTLGAQFWAVSRAERLWSLWITAFQLLMVIIHLIYFLSPGRVEFASYLGGWAVCSAAGILALTFGVWDAWAERRRKAQARAAPSAVPGATLR